MIISAYCIVSMVGSWHIQRHFNNGKMVYSLWFRQWVCINRQFSLCKTSKSSAPHIVIMPEIRIRWQPHTHTHKSERAEKRLVNKLNSNNFLMAKVESRHTPNTIKSVSNPNAIDRAVVTEAFCSWPWRKRACIVRREW